MTAAPTEAFPPLRDHHRVVLLQHDGLDSLTGKTGLAMLRYRSGPVVAVIDPRHAGADLRRLTGIDRSVPVVASMEEALRHGPEVAVIGLAPSGGRLPAPLREDMLLGLRAGLHLANGLHTRLAADDAVRAACRPGCRVWDLRVEPDGLVVAAARAAGLPGRRVLALGTDMAVGKMSVCLELRAAARRRGRDCRFVGTGQAGILIGGWGIPLDAVRVDYAAGAVEQAVLTAAGGLPDDGLLLVEGQGSFCHPGSSAGLPLLRGSQPTDLLLVHRAGQTRIDRVPAVPIPPLRRLVPLLEDLAALAVPEGRAGARVRGVALNTAHLDEAEARRSIARTAGELALPCTDPVRFGAEPLLEAIPGGDSGSRGRS